MAMLFRRMSHAFDGGRMDFTHHFILAIGSRPFGRCVVTYLRHLIFLLLILLPLEGVASSPPNVASWTLRSWEMVPIESGFPDVSSCMQAAYKPTSGCFAGSIKGDITNITFLVQPPSIGFSYLFIIPVIDVREECLYYCTSMPTCPSGESLWYGMISYPTNTNFTYWCGGPPSCPDGQSLSPDGMTCQIDACAPQLNVNGTCVDPVALKENGSDCSKNKRAPSLAKGNPINIATGNKFQVETDYSATGTFPLSFKRYYNSSNTVANANVGQHWRSNFDRSIVIPSDPTALMMYRPDGKGFAWRKAVADGDIIGRPEQIPGGWRYTNQNDEVETYDTAGKLTSITSSSGLKLMLAYDTSGRLASVTDSFGGSLTFGYDANGRVETMTDPANAIYTYAYDANGNLASVTYPDGSIRQYLYNELDFTSGANLPNALTGIIDENGARFATWNYDSQGRAISSEHGLGIDKVTVDFVSNSNGTGSSAVTDALGTTRTTNFQTILGVARNIGESQPGGSGCGPASSAITYDANANVASRADFNGNKTCYAYDLTRNLEIARVEGVAAGKACPANIASYTPASGTAERVIKTTWHSTFRLPVTITEAGRETSYVYDAKGNTTQRRIRDTAINATRTWNWAYTYSTIVPGLMVKKIENGPRTDVSDLTTTDYYDADYACTGDPKGCRGQVSQITNALGHVTRITRYNAHGQPEEIIDPNGLVMTLAYDERQRLVSRTSGSEVTSYEYDPAGQLIRFTRPDNSVLNFDYDAAQRLVGISDNLGNSISYTLDAMGNPIKEEVRDPASQLAQTRSREYDALSRLYHDIGASNQTTTLAYDATGNLKQTTDPLTHSTSNNFDALDRLVQITNPDGGQIRLTQDTLDRVVSVTDPKGVTTTYTYNGLGDLTREVSADRGITTYTYDSAGNLLTRTDARGVKHTYTYDALNRPISRSQTVAKGVKGIPASPSLTWSYDANTNGIGHLTGMSDETGSTAYSYDAYGRLLSKAQTVTSGNTTLTHTLAYAYDSAGRLVRQTYPSGAQVDMSYGIDGRPVVIRVNGQVLISDIVYQPFGAAKAWTWGNGTPYDRQFDSDGRLSQYPVGSETRTLGFDAAGRIVNYSHANPVFNRLFEYNAVNRLTREMDNIGVSLWTYDLNSNRTSATLGSNAYGYAYQSTSNRLTSVAGPVAKTYSYDAAGNIIGDGKLTYTYNAAGRLSKAAGGSGKNAFSNTYLHNANGERVIKTGSYLANGPYFFLYDPAGHVVGEYDNSNNVREETVWLGDTPVAVLKKNAQGQIQTYAVHADHLDSPRAIVDSQSRMVWRWLGSAFGQNLPEEDPDGDGTLFEYNLRFPGQYYDKETSLHYNTFRDYDPSTGRYVESDPIGLEGGMNTYAYVEGNPLSYIDPEGLAACTVLFPDYPIDTGFGFSSTSLGGHGGVVSYDDASGSTRYYEYGRYSPNDPRVIGDKQSSDEGNVRRVGIPDLVIDPKTGQPTPESLEALRRALSERAGHKTRAELTCDKDADTKKVNKYAEDYAKNVNRPPYSWKPWSSNQCRDFANRAVRAGKR